MFDEGAQLFGAMGRYSNGGKEYDKALYNTLWNTPPLYTRDTSGSKLRLYDPRFNMAFATHADVTIKLLDGIFVLKLFKALKQTILFCNID